MGKAIGKRTPSSGMPAFKHTDSLDLKEERYRTILEAIEEGFCEFDLDGNILFVNETGAKFIGSTPEKLIGTNFRKYTDPALTGNLLNVFKDIYKTGEAARRVEMEFVGKDGIRHHVEISGTLMRDAEGKPTGFRGLAHDITQRKWTEEALLQSEAKYFSIVEGIGDAYFETDITGIFTFINDKVCKDLGYSREELLRMSNRDIQDETSSQETYAIFNEVYETGRSVKEFQFKAIRKDGTRAIFEISISLMRDAQGKPIGFRGLSRDITERKKIEEALKASEDKFRKAFMISPDSVVITRWVDNVMVSVNSSFIELTGYEEEELTGKTSKDMHLWKDWADRERILEKLEVDAVVNNFEARFVKKTGEMIYVFISASVIDLGGVRHALWIIRDFTDRKKMEDALRSSEERSRTIIDTIPDPYFESDLKGRILYINAAFSSLMGYTLEELRQVNYLTYLDDKNNTIVVDLYKTVYRTGLTMKNVDVEITVKNGEKRLVNLSVSLIRDPEGKPTGFHGIVRDITEKKKAEELIRQSEKSLREYSETLEARVRERTAELEKSKVAAEVASRAKSDFMANISHEFQTPLNSVIGFTKVLQDRMFGELNEKQDEFLRYIADAGTSLSRIITEILDASHISTGSVNLNLMSISLVGMLSKTSKMLALLMEEKNQVMAMDVDLDADIRIEVDEQKIQQVFFHLLSNAVKYTPEGGKISVRAFRTRQESSGREGINIAFTDTGIGIKAEDLPRLFQAFGTLESPYTRSGEGIGMGLALTKKLVELHDGTIHVESEYGRGSCFTVFLPLRQKQAGLME